MPPAARGGDTPQLPEDYFPQLKLVLEEALRQSPRMLLARLELDAAAGDRAQARSGLYPSVRAYTRATLTSDLRKDLPGQSFNSTKTFYDVLLSQPLFHWGERRNTARIGDIRAAMAERNYVEGYRQLAREIRHAYLSLILLKSQLAGARFSSEQAVSALQAAEERTKLGIITPSELFGPQIALERAALYEASIESTARATREQLEVLSGSPAPSEAELPDALPQIKSEFAQTEFSRAEAFVEPVYETPALQNLRQQTEVDRLTYKNQKTRLRPKFNLVLGVSQDEQSYTINNGQRYGVTSRYAGIQATWSIFDGWATRGAVRSALARLRLSEARYEQARSAATRQARAAARALDLAEQQMRINDRLLASSSDYLRIREEDFAAGRVTRDTLDQAQAGYYSALASANTARLNFLMARVDLLTQIDRDPLIEHLPQP